MTTHFKAQPQEPRLRAQAVLEDLLLESPAVEELLTEAAVAAVAGSERSCGITYRGRYGVLTVASSDSRASAVDELQYASGDGPCLQAMRTAQPVRVEDLSTETRWNDYPRLAMGVGIQASLSYPLLVGRDSVGAFNLYASDPVSWIADDDAVVLLLAHQVAGILQAVRTMACEMAADEHTMHALADQPSIDVATGIVMSRRHCSEREAREWLSAGAAEDGVPIYQIAVGLVAGVTPGDA
jgi:hypothetical protein